MTTSSLLPWDPGSFPLMLAPMQGLTNRVMRRAFIEWVRPDVVFTEFVRVSAVARKRVTRSDRTEAAATFGGVPLVVQLIGHGLEPLTRAAEEVVDAGAVHLNLNLGCPYGRHTTGLTGGEMLRTPGVLPALLAGLRRVTPGSFSVKMRGGYDEPRQVLTLLPVLEDAGVDFLVLHPRTVAQKYTGAADHRITAEVADATRLPVIANGDIVGVGDGRSIRERCRVAGLMLGRGAIADPLLFERLRGRAPERPADGAALQGVACLLLKVLPTYRETFCGDTQVLHKLKGVLAAVEAPAAQGVVRHLKGLRRLDAFEAQLHELAGDCPQARPGA